MDAPLPFENEFEDKPRWVRSRAGLVAFETEAIEWGDAGICAPFEILLAPWGEAKTICSTAFARSLSQGESPFIALGAHATDGPRKWQGGGPNYADENTIERHLRRALPALLRRRLWGRVLWLDRELNLAGEEMGVLRLYLGADGRGEWFLPGLTDTVSVRAPFNWDDPNRVSLLLDSSDDELLEWVHVGAERTASDLAFSLNWISWGWTQPAEEKRVALNFQTARDSLDEMRLVMRLASQCEPELAGLNHICWEVDPLTAPAQSFGPPDRWKARLPVNQAKAEYLFDGDGHCGLPPFLRGIREWAHLWFGVQLNHELRARHRCVASVRGHLTFVVERLQPLTAHQQIESYAQLRDFLAERVAPDELARLLLLRLD